MTTTGSSHLLVIFHSPIPWFWNCSVPYPLWTQSFGSLSSIPWVWDSSIPDPFWAQSHGPFNLSALSLGLLNSLYPLRSILGPLQAQSLRFGVPQSLGPFTLNSMVLGLLNPSGVSITTQPLLSLIPHDLEKTSLNHTGSFKCSHYHPTSPTAASFGKSRAIHFPSLSLALLLKRKFWGCTRGNLFL